MRPPRSDPALGFTNALHELFLAARRARRRAARTSWGDDISLAQCHVLEPLTDGPMTNRQLAELAGVSSPTATRMVDLLVSCRFVLRVEDPADRRRVVISLTAAGRKVLARKLRECDAVRQRIAAALDPEEQRIAADLLRRVASAVEEL